ncbi:MAG: Cof-type HAD-IIB family hydrolase, partial [Chloroflexi bacterium]|nr:Cof-type HAD-IIB family hydrolase [Chloroflexota bacterium]
YRPETGTQELLAEPPPPELVEELRRRGVRSLDTGQVIVKTSEPYQNLVLEAIRDWGLELAVIFNKGSVMILPTGVNKATGLRQTLKELDLDPQQVVAVGDAENDHALLRTCGLGVSVANGLPSLREQADWVTRLPGGAGVAELIDRLIEDEGLFVPRPEHHLAPTTENSLDHVSVEASRASG